MERIIEPPARAEGVETILHGAQMTFADDELLRKTGTLFNFRHDAFTPRR